jgi:hypothetical protein
VVIEYLKKDIWDRPTDAQLRIDSGSTLDLSPNTTKTQTPSKLTNWIFKKGTKPSLRKCGRNGWNATRLVAQLNNRGMGICFKKIVN